MFSNCVFCDNNSEGIHVVGCFKSQFKTFIPDKLIIFKENYILMSLDHENEPVDFNFKDDSVLKIELVINDDEWVVVDNSNIRIIKRESIKEWCDGKSHDLVQEAISINGNPLLVLNLLQSASNLKNINLGNFVTALNSKKSNADEKLTDVFSRVYSEIHKTSQK